MIKLVKAIQLWSEDKGLKKTNPINQILKIYEEVIKNIELLEMSEENG